MVENTSKNNIQKVNQLKTLSVEVPIYEKFCLTLEEASQYFGIGVNSIRRITNEKNCKCVVWVGSKRLIKRKMFEKYLEDTYSI